MLGGNWVVMDGGKRGQPIALTFKEIKVLEGKLGKPNLVHFSNSILSISREGGQESRLSVWGGQQFSFTIHAIEFFLLFST